jgi:hydrogenase expression/formation protein HypE
MKFKKVVLAHGGGGTYMNQLLKEVILPSLGEAGRGLELEDSAFLKGTDKDFAFTTDSFVVSPRIFPGGSLGALSIIGTANDLAVSGARPLSIALSLIIEEGFDIDELKTHIHNAGIVARDAGISIVCGDTKVVPRSNADGLFITTTGIGIIEKKPITINDVCAGDEIIISGDIGRHEASIISARGELSVEIDVESDMRLLYPGIIELINNVPVHFIRDLTRGGLAMCLHDVVEAQDVSISVEEDAVPVLPQVRGLSEILGIEIYALANEGTFLSIVKKGYGEKAVEILRDTGFENASRIGEVLKSENKPKMARVKVKTKYGTTRLLPAPLGETSPRIC